MCPLRLILIFLSATLAGFFVLRNLKSQPKLDDNADSPNDSVNVTFQIQSSESPSSSVTASSKVCAVIGMGFWTCVDMASGRYLWRNLVSSSSSSSKRAN